MCISSHRSFFLSGAVTVALLAGCSGGGSQFPAANAPVSPLSQSVRTVQSGAAIIPSVFPPSMHQSQWLSKLEPTHRTGFVNVAGVNALHGNQTILSELATGSVTVYNAAGQLTALLILGLKDPQGLATDAAETLYVANLLNNNVAVYRKPYTTIGLTLNDANEYPEDVAVSKTGLVGVTNFTDTSGIGSTGSVRFYAKGSTVACATVSGGPNWFLYFFDAFDASGNLFIDGRDPNGNTLVGEVSGGCKATAITTLSVANTIYFPGGIQVQHGNILIDDQQNRAINVYAPPSGGSLGSPIATTSLTGAIDPVTFAMTKDGDALWIADNTQSFLQLPSASKYTFPGGRLEKSINDGILAPLGVAVNPAASP